MLLTSSYTVIAAYLSLRNSQLLAFLSLYSPPAREMWYTKPHVFVGIKRYDLGDQKPDRKSQVRDRAQASKDRIAERKVELANKKPKEKKQDYF